MSSGMQPAQRRCRGVAGSLAGSTASSAADSAAGSLSGGTEHEHAHHAERDAERDFSALDTLLVEAFEDVKNRFYRPPITGPAIMHENWELLELLGVPGTAFIDWLEHKITINASFVEGMAAHLPPPYAASPDDALRTIARGLLSHEFGHYRSHPRDLSLSLYLSFMAEKKFGEAAPAIYPLYTDFQNNLATILDGFGAELAPTLEAGDRMNSAMHNQPATKALFLTYAHFVPQLDIPDDLSAFPDEMQEKIRAAVEQLAGMTLTARDTSFSNLMPRDNGVEYAMLCRFGTALLPLLEPPEGEGQGAGCGCGSGQAKLLTPEDMRGLSPEQRAAVEEAIRENIKSLPRGLYEEMRRRYLGDEKTDSDNEPSMGIGLGFNDAKNADENTVRYYREAANQFGIIIRRRRHQGSAPMPINFGTRDWQPASEPQMLDMQQSGGKIIPGVSMVPRRGHVPYPAPEEIVPRLLLYKDASGSMPDPRKSKCYPTIAAAIYILSYRKAGAPVGVVLFDSASTDVFYSRNTDELLAVACGYKGGGTDVDLERLRHDLETGGKSEQYRRYDHLSASELMHDPLMRAYLRKKARVALPSETRAQQLTDFIILTDGGIANLDELSAFMREHSEEYRPTIIHTGGFSLNLSGYDGKTSGTYDGIAVLHAESHSDIIGIARKNIKGNLMENYNG